MSLFQHIDITTFSGGRIVGIEPGSVAADIGLLSGDKLLGINDQKVEDVIDVQYYGAEESLELLIQRDEGLLIFEAERAYNQTLGIEFAHPTFDTDIRRCNNLCEFCFVLQMAPRFRRTLYIKDDDYRYSFLFGHYVTLTNLSEHDWWRIETMGLSPLYVSVHVTDTEKRQQYLRNKKAPDILEQLGRLAAYGIIVHTQIVVTPGYNDGDLLEQSVQDLANLWPTVQSISVVPVGLTTHHKYSMRPHTPEEAAVVLDFVESLQSQYAEKWGIQFLYPTDEWYLVTGREVPQLDVYDDLELHENGLGMVRYFLNEWAEVKREIGDYSTSGWGLEVDGESRISNLESLTLVTAMLFANTLEKVAREFAELAGVETAVIPIVNGRLGNSITVAGLLMASDVLNQLEASGYGDLVVLPRVMFDHPDTISLDDISPQECANRLGCTVALADTMGDVWDAVMGKSKVIWEPTGISLKVQNES